MRPNYLSTSNLARHDRNAKGCWESRQVRDKVRDEDAGDEQRCQGGYHKDRRSAVRAGTAGRQRYLSRPVSPCRTAYLVSSGKLWRFSLCMMLRRCVSIVLTLRYSFVAMSLVVVPSAMS